MISCFKLPAAFTTLIASVSTRAVTASGHTLKVDATWLSAGKEYFFRFRAGSHSSPVGRAHTLPAAGAASSCMAQTQAIFLGIVNDLKYADTSRRGFLRMTFTPTEAKGIWHFASTIKSRTYTVDASASQTFSG